MTEAERIPKGEKIYECFSIIEAVSFLAEANRLSQFSV
jgi:hypothetical protein